MPSAVAALRRRRRGRPRKFDVPSRAVTLTLPESVIERLAHVNADLSLAVAQLASRQKTTGTREPADLKVFGRRAVITVTPTKALESRVGVELIPYSEGRALLSFDRPQTIAELELILHDALEDTALGPDERTIFESIVAILKDARRSRKVAVLRRSIIVLEMAPGRDYRASTSSLDAARMPIVKR